MPFQTQIGEISVKRIRTTSAYEQQGGKVTLQLAWLAGKELVTVPQYWDLLQLENRTALKLGLQQFNLQLMNEIIQACATKMQIVPACKSQGKSKNSWDNSVLFILTDQVIATSQKKWKEN